MVAADIVLDDLDIGKDRRPDLTGPPSLRLYLSSPSWLAQQRAQSEVNFQ